MSTAGPTPLKLTRADIDQTIPARFEQLVRHAPDHLALVDGGARWTYDALNRQANRIAHAVRARTPPGPGCIACLVDQSGEMIVATLSVLKAGKAYLAIHPGMPPAAQVAILRDAQPSLVLTTAALAARARDLARGTCDVLELDRSGDDLPSDDPESSADPRHPATIFFTSGTTGAPKGVVRSHRAVLHRAWLSSLYEHVVPADRQSHLTHSSFAAAQVDMAGALLLGATLSVFDVTKAGLTAFGHWIDHEQITLLRPPVQLFRRFLASLEAERRFPSVRIVSLGGDVVPASDLEQWKRHFVRPAVVLHRFSTTETTLLTSDRIDHDTVLTPEVVAAGSPVADKRFRLVDQDGRPVPAGETGELVVTSEFISDGYWRRPADTARAFVPDLEHPELTSYRTGDLGRLLPDGRFLFLGRRDHQVKIRGYRVEIAEVEAAMRALDDVSDIAVVAASRNQEQRLLAFVAMRPGHAFDAESLRRRLHAVLPEWKIPARLYPLSSLPTTPNGKIDRQRLIEHATGEDAMPSTQAPAHAFVAPADDLEQQIASVFQGILRCGPVGRTHDFFLLGGDSLQATALHLQLERLAQRSIPLETLVADATVAGIAIVVRAASQSDASVRPPVLVPLRTTGTQPALFFVHGRLGQAFVSPYFLEVLGADQPVYAFQATGLDRSRMRHNTVPEMAQEYIRAMRRVQPAGPYFLGAACAGGLIAAEMASQLRSAGAAVGPLLLVDPVATPAGDRPWWIRVAMLGRIHFRRVVRRTPADARMVRNLRQRAEQGRIALDANDSASLEAAALAASNFEIARIKYRHWRYDGPVLMLRSSARLRLDGPDWRGPFSRHLTGDVRWFDIGGAHGDVRRPGNEHLARHLRTAAAIAQDALAALRGRPL